MQNKEKENIYSEYIIQQDIPEKERPTNNYSSIMEKERQKTYNLYNIPNFGMESAKKIIKSLNPSK